MMLLFNMDFKLHSVFILTCYWTVTYSHPQCLDFRPPFTLQNSNSVFCQQYSKFGCCTKQQHMDLRNKYTTISIRLQSSGLSHCLSYLKDMLCQECSPYAAHIYDSETTLVKRPLPGLCSNYCSYLYSSCRSIIYYLTNDARVRQSLSHQTVFCSNNAISDKDYCYPDIMNNTGLNNAIDRQAKTEEGCLCLEEFARDLRNPLIFRSPDDQSGRIFVGVQLGIVYIYYRNGSKEKEPFMDLTHVVLTSSNNGDERGFLGLAFHPNFKKNGKFYVYFTLRGTSGDQRARISEFKVSSNNPNKVDKNSERKILEVKQPYSNHNGGELMFGIDGYLYSFLGDGGAGGDPLNNGQNKNSLLGSVLRLDVDTNDNNKPYKVPADNPFVNDADAKPEIYAYGIRNIWRCDLDEGDPVTGYGKGRIICGDVGQSKYEEIDLIIKGGNYGWNAREGPDCYRWDKCGKIGKEELPIHYYDHTVGNSVTGGHVYRGCLNPNLQGMYIYGDYGRGKIFRLKESPTSKTGWVNKEIKMCGTDVCFNGLTNQYERNILSFGEDFDGEIYMLTTNWASPMAFNGKIYRIVDPRRRGDMDTCRSSNWSSQTTTTTRKPTTQTLSTTTTKKTTRLPTTTRKKTTTTTTRKRTTVTTKPPTTSRSTIPSTSIGSTTSTVLTSTAPGAIPVCADLAFVVDGSGSVSKTRFTAILDYIVELLDKLYIGPRSFQVGAITFGNKASINVRLNSYYKRSSLQAAIKRIPYKDENTNTSGGLIRMRTELFPDAYGGRKGYPKIGILITDGKSTYDKHKTIPEAYRLQKERIEMFVLAFGSRLNLDATELQAIASSPLDQHLIQAPTFDIVKQRFSKYWLSLIPSGENMIRCSSPSTSSSTNGMTSSTASTKTSTTSAVTSTTTMSTNSITSTTVKNIDDAFEWLCDFEPNTPADQLCGIEQSRDDEFDWTLTNTRTPSTPTGPEKAQSGEYYMFIETSNPRRYNDTAVLILPQFGSVGIHCFTFYLHMYGFHINEIELLVKHIDGSFDVRWNKRYEQGNYWLREIIQIRDMQSTDRILLVGTKGQQYSGDIAIDNLHLTNQPC